MTVTWQPEVPVEALPIVEQKYYGQMARLDFFRYYQDLRKDRAHFTKQEVRGPYCDRQ